ncbi:uncharacterized protein [Montipora foliosa]|uniref:uncharacterized protein n=1 Tax=Montipora foliosa TaxID=591990 RepID=UPI0035F20074
MDCMFSVNRGPLTPRKRDASQFEECRRRAQIQRMKNAFRRLLFRSEPTIGEEHLRRSAKCTAVAPSTRGDLVVEKKYEDLIHDFVPDCFEHIQNFHHYRSDLARINSGFKVIYLSDSERTANSENELRKVYKQYVKSVSPNSSFKGHLQRVRGNTMQPEKIENKNEVAKDTLTFPTRQRWSERATPPWQQYRVLCDAFRLNNSPQSVVCRKRYPNGYKRPKFVSTTELEYYIHVVSEAYV